MRLPEISPSTQSTLPTNETSVEFRHICAATLSSAIALLSSKATDRYLDAASLSSVLSAVGTIVGALAYGGFHYRYLCLLYFTDTKNKEVQSSPVELVDEREEVIEDIDFQI